MGADNFTVINDGKNIQDAFDKAVEDAYYWHGHGGYTGSICEKPGFSEFDIPTDLPDSEFEGHRSWASVADRISGALTEIAYRNWETNVEAKTEDELIARLSEEGGWPLQKQNRADAIWLLKKIGLAKAKLISDTHEDKWAPAVAFKITENEWAFIGYASS